MDHLDTCRACLAPKPYLFLPLGNHAPAQMLIRAEDHNKPQPSFPLNTQVCLSCGLVQIADQIPESFFRHYLYIPSGASTMHSHFMGLANVLSDIAGASGLIVDIGSNDGLLLSHCNSNGSKTLGVDPAENIAELAREKGVEVHVAYFNPETAKDLKANRGDAKVIVTTNTFNHIGDLHTFMKGVDILLAKDGTFVVEVPRSCEYILHNEFDNIYHEHVSEFSLLSMVKLAAFSGLSVTDVTHFPNIHGGSMRVFFTRSSAGKPVSAEVVRMLKEEADIGMLDAKTYDDLVKRVNELGAKIVAMLDQFKSEGKKIAGYGASARGNTLITYFGIGTNYLDFLVDRNPLKHGLYSPNTRIPIKPVEAIETEKPDVLFMLAWNFFDEIYKQQTEFRKRGGSFLVTLPEPRIVR